MHDYGTNSVSAFHEKVRLMESYRRHPPYIDPDYTWRLPDPDEVEQAPNVEPTEYLRYL